MVTGQHGQGGRSVVIIVVGVILQGLEFVTTLFQSMVGRIAVWTVIYRLNKDLATGNDAT